jgi:hypothetical protein
MKTKEELDIALKRYDEEELNEKAFKTDIDIINSHLEALAEIEKLQINGAEELSKLRAEIFKLNKKVEGNEKDHRAMERLRKGEVVLRIFEGTHNRFFEAHTGAQHLQRLAQTFEGCNAKINENDPADAILAVEDK